MELPTCVFFYYDFFMNQIFFATYLDLFVFKEKESVLDFLLQGFHYKNKILTILHELQVSAALIQVSAWKKK